MARRKVSISPQEPLAVVIERMKRLEEQVRILTAAQMSHVQTGRHETFLNPSQGMTLVDWHTFQFCFYHDNAWICIPFPATHAIKVYGDTKLNRVRNGAFKFAIEEDLDGTELIAARAFNGTVGTGTTTVQISKAGGTIDVLSTPIGIPSGTNYSFTAPTINQAGTIRQAVEGDMWWIDVDAVGTGSKGLGVYLSFAKRFEVA